MPLGAIRGAPAPRSCLAIYHPMTAFNWYLQTAIMQNMFLIPVNKVKHLEVEQLAAVELALMRSSACTGRQHAAHT